ASRRMESARSPVNAASRTVLIQPGLMVYSLISAIYLSQYATNYAHLCFRFLAHVAIQHRIGLVAADFANVISLRLVLSRLRDHSTPKRMTGKVPRIQANPLRCLFHNERYNFIR